MAATKPQICNAVKEGHTSNNLEYVSGWNSSPTNHRKYYYMPEWLVLKNGCKMKWDLPFILSLPENVFAYATFQQAFRLDTFFGKRA